MLSVFFLLGKVLSDAQLKFDEKLFLFYIPNIIYII